MFLRRNALKCYMNCHGSKVKVSALWQCPDLIKTLLTKDSPKARHFRDQMRQHNSFFAFASVGVKVELPPSRDACQNIHVLSLNCIPITYPFTISIQRTRIVG